jgi:hypothetical protein
VVVSVMNRPVARRAIQQGIPCVYVDCLLWMRPGPPRVPRGAIYFQEAFPGVATRLERWRDHLHQPEIVGPLVSRPSTVRSGEPDTVLVNFGGLSTSAMERHALVAYADSMAQCSVAALARWHHRVVVAVGKHVLRHMDRVILRTMRPGIELLDLSHARFLAELQRAHLLITSAGMHAIYEASACGVPYLCLPAQNSSQPPALRALARERLVRALDWTHLYGWADLHSHDQAGIHSRMAEMIHRFNGDSHARERLVRHLQACLDGRRLAPIRRRQHQFFAEQGPPGARRIAARIHELLNDVRD